MNPLTVISVYLCDHIFKNLFDIVKVGNCVRIATVTSELTNRTVIVQHRRKTDTADFANITTTKIFIPVKSESEIFMTC